MSSSTSPNTIRGQSAIESAMLICAMMAIMVVFALFMSQRLVEIQTQKDKALLDDLSGVIKNEITLAGTAPSGYYRQFDLPDTLYGKRYSIHFTSASALSEALGPDKNANFSELTLSYDNYATSYETTVSLPKEAIGNIRKGTNAIRSRDGHLFISEVCSTCFANEELCREADSSQPNLCDGLDIFGEGYRDACCSEYLYCC